MKKAIIASVLAIFSLMNSTVHPDAPQVDSYQQQQEKMLEKLYHKWYSPSLRSIITKRSFSKLAGKWAKSKLSKPAISKFIKNYNIDMDESQQPIGSFATLNDFFIRKLKPGARPLSSDPSAIISPADGNVLAVQNIGKNSLFPIKNLSFSTEKILQNKNLAELFEGGTAVIIRIAPWDYHRAHFPLSGIPGKPQPIKGQYQSVSPTVFKAGIQPMEINERHIIKFQSDKASTVAIVLVGALFVGALVETYNPGIHYKQGDELGYFEYGGSTVVLFFQKNTVTINPEIIAASKQGKETPVKMGQVIGHVLTKKNKQ